MKLCFGRVTTVNVLLVGWLCDDFDDCDGGEDEANCGMYQVQVSMFIQQKNPQTNKF